jgi:hypothetical protein
MQIIDLRDFEAIPQDFPVGKAAQLEFRKQWATQIVDEIWLPYPVEQISAILRVLILQMLQSQTRMTLWRNWSAWSVENVSLCLYLFLYEKRKLLHDSYLRIIFLRTAI